MSPDNTLEPGPPHLNSSGCLIKVSKEKGRGVYSSRFIPRDTLLDISPVLFFSKDEYQLHGKYTVLDHYTFNWTDGRMALALGLGSLFNHSNSPNLSYTLDTSADSIRYTAARDINPDEELCIFYGHKLWFSPIENTDLGLSLVSLPGVDDGWGGLSGLDDANTDSIRNPYIGGDPDEVVAEEDLPFTRFRLPPEEEEPGSIRTLQAWVVDIPDPRHINILLRWLKQAGLDGPELGHLKRIRKLGALTTLLLSTTDDAPQLPKDLDLPDPYVLPVPSSPALTLPSLPLKTALWPTIYAPRRKGEPEPWVRGKLRWAWDAVKVMVDTALKAKTEEDELAISAHIPAPYSPSDGNISSPAFIGIDTRSSTKHPLRHAAINTIRKLADYHASQEPSTCAPGAAGILMPPEHIGNGTNYLLTDMTFFITHEPCIMCSMALLHSRVKEIVYLYPMPKTGGCGGCTCLPTLKGVNHRFNILQWKQDPRTGCFSDKELNVDTKIDA